MSHCKHAVFALAILGMAPAPALATGGSVGVYGDVNGFVCDLYDAGGVIIAAVVHKPGPVGVTGSRFRVQAPANWQLGSFTTPHPHVGLVEEDISVGYPECVTQPIVAGSVTWFSTSVSPTCSSLSVEPPPGFGAVVVLDCTFQEISGTGFRSAVNPDGQCCCFCLATEQSTWGSVKALYR